MQYPARLIPPSYVFESMRKIVANQRPSPADLAIGLALALVYVFVMGAFFAHVYRYVVRSGLIARYSAESLS
jgi:ABC-2 type transport system permease protein